MSFTFVHTADWQLGKPFARFPPDVAARLAAARLDAIDEVARVGVNAGAGHVLVAGDVLDSERAGDGLIRAALARMAVWPQLAWHLIPGNHDPARSGGVWARILALGPARNVTAHTTAEPRLIAPGVLLLPAPLTAREMRTDPTAWMDTHAGPEGAIRIGLAHGSVQGFGSLGEAAVPIAPERRRSARLDYLALGDWHGTREVAPGVWYAGTPEPDAFADNKPGNALLVRLAGPGAEPEVEVVATAAYRWLDRRLVVDRLADLAVIEDEVSGLGTGASRHLMALSLEGALAASDFAALEARLAGLAARLMSLEVDRRRLRTAVTPDDLVALGPGREGLVEIVGRLKATIEGAPAAEARVAGRALQLLLALAAPAAGGEAA